MQKNASFFEVIQHKGFLNLWINQILVQFSNNSLNFALIFWVFHLTNSNTAVSALLFAIYLPAVIFGLFSGILVDITDRRKIILAINILLSLSFLSLIFLKESYPMVLLITFFINTLGQFYSPAEASAIPLIVKRPQLLVANSLFTITMFSTFLIGFGLAGPLINNLGINTIFILGGILLFIAFLLAFKFPPMVNKADKEGRMLLKFFTSKDFNGVEKIIFLEIKKTLNIIRGKFPVLFSIIIMAGVQIIIGVLAVVISAFLEREIGIHKEDASYVLVIPLGIGMLIGGFLIKRYGSKIPKRIIVGRGVLVAGLLFLILGVAPMLSPAIKYFPKPRPLPFFYQVNLSSILVLGSLILGIAMVSIITPSQTVIQENTPEEIRGKVFSVLGVVMQGLTLIPVFLVGVLADFFGTLAVFIIMGLIIIIMGHLILRPNFYFNKNQLPLKLREFLGEGHWED